MKVLQANMHRSKTAYADRRLRSQLYYIFVEDEHPNRQSKTKTNITKFYLVKMKGELLIEQIKDVSFSTEEVYIDARNLLNQRMRAIQEACNASKTKSGYIFNKTTVYW